jgi:predicted RNA binding protein with dsRBD fold (UPF0201 family)
MASRGVSLKTTVKARLNSTEDPEKLEKAIRNMFGDIPIQQFREGRSIILQSQFDDKVGLNTLRQKIARDRIRDSIRSMLNRWHAKEDKVSFDLNRQAAFAGHVSIYHASKSPLGPIEVVIEGNPERIIEFLSGKVTD